MNMDIKNLIKNYVDGLFNNIIKIENIIKNRKTHGIYSKKIFIKKKSISKEKMNKEKDNKYDIEKLMEDFSLLKIPDVELPEIMSKELKNWAIYERNNIYKERTLMRNKPFAFLGVGELGEELVLYMYPETIGSASKGGIAFDNKTIDIKTKELISAKEIKTVCLEGSKICINCKNKAPRFQPKCIYCDNSMFKLIADSRAGISSKQHIIYKEYLKEYIIFVIKYIEDKNIISFKGYKFLSSNDYFDKYINNQYVSGSSKGGTCNFLPYSYDWYLSGPIKIMDINIDINNEEPIITTLYYNIQNTSIEYVPKSIFNKIELDKYELNDNIEEYEYQYIMSKGVTIRNKNIGKSRGVVTRK
jgi:hypothetical protein